MSARLETGDHDRYAEGLRYIYPVVSRRAEGVSVGINLNPNNACNWRCAYCQVEGLQFGKGPAIDQARLEGELRDLLGAIVNGDFLEQRAPLGSRRLNDVAFSGNGEPTGSPDFEAALETVGIVLDELNLLGSLPIVLITNGSLAHKENVQAGLRRANSLGGVAWFKLDGASDASLLRTNDAKTGIARQLDNLRATASLLPTWVQTALFERDGMIMEGEFDTYLAHLKRLLAEGVPLKGVHLYGLARASYQPEAPQLTRLSQAILDEHADRIRSLGLQVTSNP